MNILAELERLRLTHYICEDCWYSCPKSTEGCCDDNQGSECNCGADAHNAILDGIKAYAMDDQNVVDVGYSKDGRQILWRAFFDVA